MPTDEGTPHIVDVPERVFSDFLNALSKTDVDVAIVERLRKTLLVERTFSDRALKEALFPEVTDL
jgi:hypothetical protein